MQTTEDNEKQILQGEGEMGKKVGRRRAGLSRGKRERMTEEDSVIEAS